MGSTAIAPKQYLDDDGNPITADVKLPKGYSLLSSKSPSAPKKKVKELKEQASKLAPVVPPSGYLLDPDATLKAGMPQGHLESYTPSVLHQFRDTVANGAVGRSLQQEMPKVAAALNLTPSETIQSPTYKAHGEQLLAPEYMAPSVASISPVPLTQAGKERVEGALEGLGNMTSGKSLATMAGTAVAAGLTAGIVNPASAQLLSRLVSGGFTLDMLHGLYQQSKEYRKAVDSGNLAEAHKIQGEMGVTGVMALLTGKHALTPHPVGPVETGEVNDTTGKPPQVLVPPVSGELSKTPAGTGSNGAGETPSIPHENQPLAEARPEGRGGSEAAGDLAQPSVGLEQKPLHEMSPAEIEEEYGKAQNRDKQDVIDIFGEDGAKKWNQLQRASNNSYDMQRADRASAELQEMESKLTPEQQNRLYGIGDTRHSLEDLKDYRDAYHGIDDSSPEALGQSLRWAVSQVGDPTRAPESMTPKERVRLAQLRYGYEDAVKNGYDPMEVMRAAVKSAAERFKDPEDAKLMLRDVVKALHIDGGEPPTQKALPIIPDRRQDSATRKRVEHMSPEEMRKALLTSDKTGIPNRRAFDDAEHVSPSPAVAMSDADGLKALNDRFGYAAGDELLKAKAEALKAAGLDAYHEKGDEFVYRGASPQDLKEKLDKARQILRDRTIEVTLKDGKKLYFKGADFSYGTGKSLDESEAGLKDHKEAREKAGERSRGELRGITETQP